MSSLEEILDCEGTLMNEFIEEVKERKRALANIACEDALVKRDFEEVLRCVCDGACLSFIQVPVSSSQKTKQSLLSTNPITKATSSPPSSTYRIPSSVNAIDWLWSMELTNEQMHNLFCALYDESTPHNNFLGMISNLKFHTTLVCSFISHSDCWSEWVNLFHIPLELAYPTPFLSNHSISQIDQYEAIFGFINRYKHFQKLAKIYNTLVQLIPEDCVWIILKFSFDVDR